MFFNLLELGTIVVFRETVQVLGFSRCMLQVDFIKVGHFTGLVNISA